MMIIFLLYYAAIRDTTTNTVVQRMTRLLLSHLLSPHLATLGPTVYKCAPPTYAEAIHSSTARALLECSTRSLYGVSFRMQVGPSLSSEETFVLTENSVSPIGSVACAIRTKILSICLESARICLCPPTMCGQSMLTRLSVPALRFFADASWTLRKSSKLPFGYTCT